MRSTTLGVIAVGTGLVMALTACGANSSSNSGGSSGGGSTASSGPLVGVILPDTTSSTRYTQFDQPMLQKALTAQGLHPLIQNAQGDDQKFAQITDSMLAQHVKVLIIDPPDGSTGVQAEQKAKAQGVPVIDYDRLNLGGSADYYVSFDNVKVGELQGQALATALQSKPGAQVIEVEGAPTDNNATLFHQGQEQVLQPLYASGKLKKVASQFIDNWDNQKGGTAFEQMLTANGGHVDGVLSANDGLAGAIITVLQKNGLAGKIPVTGQDASAQGLQSILEGVQYSTVFKPEQQEADSTAKLAKDLSTGNTSAADALATQSSSDPTPGHTRTVKSILLQPISITKDNVKTVVQQGYVKASDICGGSAASVCSQLSIS
jgi:D-xylose transport system substrate-binding protein